MLGHVAGETAAHIKYEPEWPPLNINIRVDANNQPHAQYVIHELLHVVFDPMILGYVDETLEEAIILGLDHYMWEYVKKSKTRLGQWNELIEHKLATRPDRSLEEQADRS